MNIINNTPVIDIKSKIVNRVTIFSRVYWQLVFYFSRF